MSVSLQEAEEFHHFSVEDYLKLFEVGLLQEGKRYELLEGNIVDVSPASPQHAFVIKKLIRLFSHHEKTADGLHVQSPVQLGKFSFPEPDLFIAAPSADDYATSHPTSKDMLLAVEVSVSSARVDTVTKARIYAEHEVPEYWVFLVGSREVLRHSSPENGSYTKVVTFSVHDILASATIPGLQVPLSGIFPPAAP